MNYQAVETTCYECENLKLEIARLENAIEDVQRMRFNERARAERLLGQLLLALQRGGLFMLAPEKRKDKIE